MNKLLFTLLFCFLAGWLPAKQVSPDHRVGTYTRDGNTMTYDWEHICEDGRSVRVVFSINFDKGWHRMQDKYQSKNHQHGDYNRFVDGDPYKIYLYRLSRLLRSYAEYYHTSETALALSFVQALPYQDPGSYQRYAVETLIDAKGDCSDTSVLLAGIYAAWDYDCVFLGFPRHLAVGIWNTPIPGGTYYRISGRNYYYCETTGTGWKIGSIPDDYDYCDETWDVRVNWFS